MAPSGGRIHLPESGRPGAADEPVTVAVRLSAESYEIKVAAGMLGEIGRLYPPRPGARAAVITAETVAGLYEEQCLSALRAGGWEATALVVPNGEQSKTLAQAEKLYEGCLDAGLDRGSTVFALGGGVVGDLAGFVAGTYMRGLPFVQIPTTLLAQVDASVGGKTAVDLPRGKNLVGVFHQPSLVAIDVATLQSLTERELRAGLAEVVKHAAIADAEMFEWLEQNGQTLLQRELICLRQIVARNCQIKAEVVEADPQEKGLRAILNYGHTVGHAIELGAGQWDLRHGEAVAYGMVAEARLAVRLGLAAEDVAQRQEALLQALGLAQGVPPVDLERAREALLHDKKLVNGRLRLPLTPAIGEVVLRDDVPLEELLAALWEVCSAAH